MNLGNFYNDLATYVDGILPSAWKVYAEKIQDSWDKTVILNISDAVHSPDSEVSKIECEFIFTAEDYDAMATEALSVLNQIHHFRGLFPSVGGDTRAHITENIHGIKIREDRSEGKTIDLPHLRFVAMFYIENLEV